MAKVVKGKYAYEDDSKKSKKKLRREKEELQKKMLRKQDKELKKQCDCNHLDSKNNKAYLKESKDGLTYTCKICGGVMIKNPDMLTPEAVDSAKTTIYTVLGLARNRLNIDEETDRQITKTLLMVSRTPEIVTHLKDSVKGKKKNKNSKKKGNKKGNKRHNRLTY